MIFHGLPSYKLSTTTSLKHHNVRPVTARLGKCFLSRGSGGKNSWGETCWGYLESLAGYFIDSAICFLFRSSL